MSMPETASTAFVSSERKESPSSAPVDFAPAAVEVVPTAEGGYLLSSPRPLQPYEKTLGVLLRRWTRETPEKPFLGEKRPDGLWRILTWGEAGRRAEAVAQALIDRDLGPQRPVMILSGNSINHALLMLGGFISGVPVVPVSVAYSLLSQDLAKIRYVFEEVRPALIYVENGSMFARALKSIDLSGVEVVTGDGSGEEFDPTPLDALLAAPVTGEVERAFSMVNGDTTAKILFSSGSTGLPKGVINTHEMLCANQQMLAQVWPFITKTPPVLVDWLPWNHTFGGNHNFNLILKTGGTLYIDGGKPLPGMVEETVRNLAEISPTIYFNVPAGYAMLLPHLEKDEHLCRNFFERLQLIFYAGAALSQDLWRRLEKVAIRATGRKIAMTSSWGSTETSPLSTAAHFTIEKAGVIGLPCPGVTLKMVPGSGKFELRVKGPHVTPGYLNRPDLTEAAFDEEGFYKIGDAGSFADPDDPEKGITFDGRVAEDFKLATGTWVHVGALRLGVLAAAAPLLQDALVTGQDQDYVGILAWPNLQGCRETCGHSGGEHSAESLLYCRDVVEHLRKALSEFNAHQEGFSAKVRRVMFMSEPPLIDANEITDKGYINQRAALERRWSLVERLHADVPGTDVIVV